MSGGQLLGGYPIYKAVDDPGLLMAAHRNNPNAVMIYRHWYPDAEQTARLNNMASGHIDDEVSRWIAENIDFMRLMPYAYHEAYNEVDAPLHYMLFEKRRIERLHDLGFKACIINIACAHSDEAMWKMAVDCGLIQTAVRCGAIIGEHSYAQTIMSANVGGSFWTSEGKWSGGELFPANPDPESCHTGLRILHSKKILAKLGYPEAWLVATELGWDNVAHDKENGVYAPNGNHTEGFHDCIPIWQKMNWIEPGVTALGFAMKQLNWWAKTTGCLGVVYTVGNGGNPRWNNFNVSGLL